MDRLARCDTAKRDIEGLTAAWEGRVVWYTEVDSHYLEDAGQEAFAWRNGR